MDVVLMLVRNEADRRLIRAGESEIAVQPCEYAAELARRGEDPSVIAVLSELSDRAGAATASTLAALHARRPWLPITLYLALAPDDVRQGTDLVCQGVASGIIFRGIDDVRNGLRQLAARARAMAETARVVEALAPLLAPAAERVLAVCAVESAQPLTVERVAAMLDVSPRTLAWQLHRCALPTPQRLIGWCRLLRVALRLERPHTTTKDVAASLGYPSARALAMHLRRHTALTPAKLRAAGGFAHLVAHIAAELHAGDAAAAPRDAPPRRYAIPSDHPHVIRYVSRPAH
jgi:AraC-like DNA-binding protein